MRLQARGRATHDLTKIAEQIYKLLNLTLLSTHLNLTLFWWGSRACSSKKCALYYFQKSGRSTHGFNDAAWKWHLPYSTCCFYRSFLKEEPSEMDGWKWFWWFSLEATTEDSEDSCNIKWRSQSNLYAHVVYTPTVSVMTNGLNHYQFKKLRSHYWFTLVPYCERGLVALFFSISITIIVFFGKCKLVYKKNPQDNPQIKVKPESFK